MKKLIIICTIFLSLTVNSFAKNDLENPMDTDKFKESLSEAQSSVTSDFKDGNNPKANAGNVMGLMQIGTGMMQMFNGDMISMIMGAFQIVQGGTSMIPDGDGGGDGKDEPLWDENNPPPDRYKLDYEDNTTVPSFVNSSELKTDNEEENKTNNSVNSYNTNNGQNTNSAPYVSPYSYINLNNYKEFINV